MKTFKKLILDDLKSQNLGHIAKAITQVRYNKFAGGDSVYVKAVNLVGQDRETLEKLVREYQHGSFNSMEDIYEYDKSNKERSAKYTSVQFEYTDDVKLGAERVLAVKYGVTDDTTAQKVFGRWYDTVRYEVLNGTIS